MSSLHDEFIMLNVIFSLKVEFTIDDVSDALTKAGVNISQKKLKKQINTLIENDYLEEIPFDRFILKPEKHQSGGED